MIRTDEEIKRDLIDELYWDYGVDASDAKAEVSDGKVTLTGTVPSYAARDAAAAAAWGIEGVKRDIEAALERNLYVDAEKVTVKVEDGSVTLTGTLPSYVARSRAHDAAAFTPGVLEVDNDIVVG